MRLHVNAPSCEFNIKFHCQCIVNNNIPYGLMFGQNGHINGMPGAINHYAIQQHDRVLSREILILTNTYVILINCWSISKWNFTRIMQP